MGCWDETCVISGLGIRPNDPVVLVIADAPRETSVWQAKFGAFTGRYDFKRVKQIKTGTYNWYGSLEEMPESDDPGDERGVRYFFHADMWAWALKEHARITKGQPYYPIIDLGDEEAIAEPEPPAMIEEFGQVSQVMHMLRRPITVPYCGPQSTEESTVAQLHLNTLVGKRLRALRREERIREAEDEADDE